MHGIKANNTNIDIATLGTSSLARNSEHAFEIGDGDLNEHFYIIGRSGSGKSTLLKELGIADIERGAGLCFIDPIGGTAEELLTHIPHGSVATSRDKDVIYIDAADVDHPIGINPLYNIAPEDRPRAVSDILQMFEGIWHDTGWGPRMESIFRAALHTLVENPHCMRPSLLTVFRLLLDESFRDETKKAITNPQLRDWWAYRFDRGDLNERTRREWVEPVLNKIDTLSLDPLIRNIIGQPRCKLDFEEIVRKRQILIVNLNQNKVGLDNASFLGMLIISRLRQAAAKVGKREHPFSLTIDEAHAFPTMELTKIIAQGRHSGLYARIAHQHLSQFDDKISSALRNGCGSLAVFAVGHKDAETIVDDLDPNHRDRMLNQIRTLGTGETVLRLTRDGAPQPPSPNPLKITHRELGTSRIDAAIRLARERFATGKLTAEFQILESQGSLNRDDVLQWKSMFRVGRRRRQKAQRKNDPNRTGERERAGSNLVTS